MISIVSILLVELARKPTKLVGSAIANSVPSHIFHNKNYTVLESLVVYLREKRKISLRQIAKTLNRAYRQIYDAFYNAKTKQLVTEYRISTEVYQIPLSIFTNRKLSATEALVFVPQR